MFESKVHKKLANFDLINKFNFNYSINIPKIDKLVLNINIDSNDSENLLLYSKSMLALEFLGFRKPFVKKFMFAMRGKGRRHSFVTQLVLRKKFLFNFLYYFQMFVYLNLNNKFIHINKVLKKDEMYAFTISDVSVFPGLGENFLSTKVNLHFNFNINKNTLNKDELVVLLRNYCLLAR